MKSKNKSHKKIKNKEIVTKRIKIEIEKKKEGNYKYFVGG